MWRVEAGYDVYTYNPPGKSQKKGISNNRFIGTRIERRISEKISYYSDIQDGLNWFGTKKFLREINKNKPDIIHMHNMHSSFINIAMLFDYIRENDIKVVWTFHDCWDIYRTLYMF